jgi:hypothetical protein
MIAPTMRFALAFDKDPLPEPFLILVPHQEPPSIEYRYDEYVADPEEWHDMHCVYDFATVEDVRLLYLKAADRSHFHQRAKVLSLLEKEMLRQGLFTSIDIDE